MAFNFPSASRRVNSLLKSHEECDGVLKDIAQVMQFCEVFADDITIIFYNGNEVMATLTSAVRAARIAEPRSTIMLCVTCTCADDLGRLNGLVAAAMAALLTASAAFACAATTAAAAISFAAAVAVGALSNISALFNAA